MCMCACLWVCLLPWLQLRFVYDTTTIRPRSNYDLTTTYLTRFDMSKKWTCQFFHRSHVVVVLQSNWMQIIISITFVVVECVVVSSHRSRIVVESQLWYRLNMSKLCLLWTHAYGYTCTLASLLQCINSYNQICAVHIARTCWTCMFSV